MSTASEGEDLLRVLAPQVLAVLVRRTGDFDAAVKAWPHRWNHRHRHRGRTMTTP